MANRFYDFRNYQNDIDRDYVTFIIVLRIDSNERARNLDVAIKFLSQRTNVYIHILEVDSVSRCKMQFDASFIKYKFIKDDNPVFYRAKYLNGLL